MYATRVDGPHVEFCFGFVKLDFSQYAFPVISHGDIAHVALQSCSSIVASHRQLIEQNFLIQSRRVLLELVGDELDLGLVMNLMMRDLHCLLQEIGHRFFREGCT